MEEAWETLLVNAHLPVVDELHNPRQLFVLNVLQYDDRVLPGGQISQDLNKHLPSLLTVLTGTCLK